MTTVTKVILASSPKNTEVSWLNVVYLTVRLINLTAWELGGNYVFVDLSNQLSITIPQFTEKKADVEKALNTDWSQAGFSPFLV